MTELFRTVHGSRLYGMDTDSSDLDLFIVTDSTAPRAKHRIVGREDRVTVGLETFLRRVAEGSHQSVEAAFSRVKCWTDEGAAYRPMINGLLVGGPDVYEKYERTIKKFCFGDFKRRRHAVRLAFNPGELRREMRFNPKMSELQITAANLWAKELEGEALWKTITRMA